MPIRSRKNQYRGVNAHLHSYFQDDGSWESFHGAYITYLTAALSRELPDGYLVNAELSLQIRQIHPDTGEEIMTNKPDLSIYSSQVVSHSPRQNMVANMNATLTFRMTETLRYDPASYLRAVVIYEIVPNARLGKPVTQIEVLSPTNKVGGTGYGHYFAKRDMLLEGGMNLVEVDYLHETDSPIQQVPSYRKRQAHSYPYYIALNDQYPSHEEAQTFIFGFSVDDPIPSIQVPLVGDDAVWLDFGAAYQQAFEAVNTFSFVVDYEELPLNFETYSPADQDRIRRRMKAVQDAHAGGINLDENAPLLLEN